MKVIFNCFVCDNCGKKSKLMEETHKLHSGYPYDEGWVYLYDFQFKEEKNTQKRSSDKHFCSSGCMKQYIIKEIGIVVGETE